MTGGPGRWPPPMGFAAMAQGSTAAGDGLGAPGATVSVSTAAFGCESGLAGASTPYISFNLINVV